MVNYGIFLTKFLDSDTSSLMSRGLRFALIERFGGEDAFLEDYDHVADYGIEGISESFYSTSVIDFYQENKEQIKFALKNLAAVIGLNSAIALVDKASDLNEKHNINLDDIADAMYGTSATKDNPTYRGDLVISWIVSACGAELCREYQNFMSRNVNGM